MPRGVREQFSSNGFDKSAIALAVSGDPAAGSPCVNITQHEDSSSLYRPWDRFGPDLLIDL
jgi:hypothetical protein